MKSKALTIVLIAIIALALASWFVYNQFSTLQNQISELKAQNSELQEQIGELQNQNSSPFSLFIKIGRGEVHSPIIGDVSHNQISFSDSKEVLYISSPSKHSLKNEI
jgi:predicted PurR-regulated permease PerM